MGPETERVPARAAGGEASQGVKRSRFALEAEEQQVRDGTVLCLCVAVFQEACAGHSIVSCRLIGTSAGAPSCYNQLFKVCC